MKKFFSREEKLPFTYSAIEERRGKTSYSLWIGAFIILIAIIFIASFIF